MRPVVGLLQAEIELVGRVLDQEEAVQAGTQARKHEGKEPRLDRHDIGNEHCPPSQAKKGRC